jgi:hypothetical protein
VIHLEDYFGAKPRTNDQEFLAADLLDRVNALVDEAVAAGAFERMKDPDTGTEISGSRGGQGDGGFRLTTATTGRPLSSHKEARGVDGYDPLDRLDAWLDRFEGTYGTNSMLEKHGLYREHPKDTPGWCHLQTRAPGSGRRTYEP